MLRTLTAKLEALGGLKRGLRARELIMENGRCVGVIADAGSETHRLESRGVVIADGAVSRRTTTSSSASSRNIRNDCCNVTPRPGGVD